MRHSRAGWWSAAAPPRTCDWTGPPGGRETRGWGATPCPARRGRIGARPGERVRRRPPARTKALPRGVAAHPGPAGRGARQGLGPVRPNEGEALLRQPTSTSQTDTVRLGHRIVSPSDVLPAVEITGTGSTRPLTSARARRCPHRRCPAEPAPDAIPLGVLAGTPRRRRCDTSTCGVPPRPRATPAHEHGSQPTRTWFGPHGCPQGPCSGAISTSSPSVRRRRRGRRSPWGPVSPALVVGAGSVVLVRHGRGLGGIAGAPSGVRRGSRPARGARGAGASAPAPRGSASRSRSRVAPGTVTGHRQSRADNPRPGASQPVRQSCHHRRALRGAPGSVSYR